MLTESELESILKQGENAHTEFKEALTSSVLEGLSTSFCSFANTEGGRIIIGISNQNILIGCTIDIKLKERIYQEASNCAPPIHVIVNQQKFDGKEITLIDVPKSKSVVHKDKNDRFPIRLGSVTYYPDMSGLTQLFMERLGLTYSKPIGEVNKNFPRKKERTRLTNEKIEYYITRLNGKTKDVKIEILKDLIKITYEKSFMFDERILGSIKNLLNTSDPTLKNNVLELIRISFHYESDEIKKELIKRCSDRIAEIALHEFEDIQTRRNAIIVLALMNEENTVDAILKTALQTGDSVYKQLNVPTDLSYTKSVVGNDRIKSKSLDLLETDISENLKNRVKEILERIR